MSSIHPFSWKIFDSLKKQGYLKTDNHYLIAVSGGSDSVALARVFFEFQKKIKIKVSLIYFHHGLREASNKEKIFVEQLAKNWEAGYFYRENKNIKKPAIQNQARAWRNQELQKIKVTKEFDFVILAHHLDDLVETQIWRLMRGVSLFDLTGMDFIQGFFLRPLLYISKLEIKNYLQEIGQEWMEDESNFSEDYIRNYIRHQIIPKMKGAFLKEGQTGESFLHKMLMLHQEANSLKQIYRQQIPKLPTQEFLYYKQVQSLPELFGKKFLYDFLLTYQMKDLFRTQINKAHQLIMQNKKNWTLQMGKNYICIGREKKIFCQEITKLKNRKSKC